MTTAGVRVEMDGVMKNIEELAKLLDGRKRDIMRYGRSIMKQETGRAFSSKADPTTGQPWPARTRAYPWSMLRNKGDLFDSLRFGYGIKTKDRKMKWFGKIVGDQGAIVKAGSVHFGRSKARSAKGTKLRGTGPSRGATPPRPIFGFGRSARKRIKRYAEKRLARVFK